MQLARPSRVDLAWLGLAVVAISTTGPLIAATDAPALSIAFWRVAIGSALIGAWVLLRHRAELIALTRREWTLLALAGVFLGAHFATWVPSLRFTSVASSTALVATQPVWAALIARAQGVRVPRQAWIGIGIALAGVIALTGIDVSLDPRSLLGNGLALAGAISAALYMAVAERARTTVSTLITTFVLFGSAAAFTLVVAVVFTEPLIGFTPQVWGLILTLTIVGQLIGHGVLNRVVATTSATVVSLAILFEMPGATIIAAIALGQLPPIAVYPAVALIFAGLVFVIRSIRSATPLESAPA